jgi:quinohemoprotein ethanol dehydrogenase
VDRKTGRVKWHYQETPGDAWDFTATQPMLFTDLEVNGQLRPVLIHAPKNGFLFVIDRETGKPLAINALVRTSWAKGYDAKTGRAQKTPAGSAYWEGPKIVFPASPGARNWYPAAYDPDRRLYTASVLDMGNLMFATPPLDKGDGRRPKALNVQTTMLFTSDLNATLPTLPKPMQDLVKTLPEWKWVQKQPYSSQLRALDPLTGKARWAVDMQGWQDRPGVLATKTGLIFHGTLGGQFVARDADTGKVLKSIDTGSSTLAAPMTYRVHGVQYLAVATGFGGGGWGYVPRYSAAYTYGNANRLLVFKLDGAPAKKPDPLPPLEVVPAPPPQAPGVNAATLARGQAVFFANCSICHSNQPRAPLPDLRRMAPGTHEIFDKIVLEGLFLPAGMPRWNDVISAQDAHAVHAYLIDQQARVRARELRLKAAGQPLDAPALPSCRTIEETQDGEHRHHRRGRRLGGRGHGRQAGRGRADRHPAGSRMQRPHAEITRARAHQFDRAEPAVRLALHGRARSSLGGRADVWPAGKLLGGGSSLNGMMFIRGHRTDYDHWAELGATGWDYASVLPYFRRMEDNERGADAWRGAGGPITVSENRARYPITDRWIEAAQQAGILRSPDLNGQDAEGVDYVQVSQRGGQRCSTSRGYLEGRDYGGRLRVELECQVLRVKVEEGRATGVVLQRGGQERVLRARRAWC